MAKKQLTPYPELDNVLRQHADALRLALGNFIIGYYLNGSLAIGDFDMTSDIDFIVVTIGELSDAQVAIVQEIHNQMYAQDNRWAKRLEYSFFPLAKLQLPAPIFSEKPDEQDKLWYFDNGHREIEKSTHCNTCVTRWTLHNKGIAVFGPEPQSIVPAVSPEQIKQESKEAILGWGEELLANPEQYRNRFYQSYLVLNFSRMLQDLALGRITSKLDGINWAKQNLDPKWHALIDFCWQDRQDPDIHVSQPADPNIYSQTLDYVKYVMDEAQKYYVLE